MFFICVYVLTVGERKMMASAQRRRGPGVAGLGGLAQPFWDGLKLALKEPVLPSAADQPSFFWAPVMSFVLSQAMWSVIPLNGSTVLSGVTGAFPSMSVQSSTSLQAVTLLAISSLAVYGILLAGWSSNSRYALLGSCRSVAQMVSYELPLGVTVLSLATRAPHGDRSLSLADMIASQLSSASMCLVLWPLLFLWAVALVGPSPSRDGP